jgi:hypothetical protein
MRSRAIAVVLVVVGVTVAVVLRPDGDGGDPPAVDATKALDRACAARAPDVDGPFAAVPEGPRDVDAIVRGAATDVRELDLGRQGGADLLLRTLTDYADAARRAASGDALVDPLPVVEDLERARGRLDRVAAELGVPGCAASALAPRRSAGLR